VWDCVLRSRSAFTAVGLLAIAIAGAALVWQAEPPAAAVAQAPMAANGDEWFELQRAYPSSKPAPVDALANAMASWRGNTDRSPRPKFAITTDRWVSIGPQPIGVSNGLTYAGRIENLDSEMQELSEQKKEVFAEAKGEGFDVKILKEIIKLRKEDKNERDERESLLDLYMRAMETASPEQAKAA